MTILKNHEWYLCQISLLIMLLPALSENSLNGIPDRLVRICILTVLVYFLFLFFFVLLFSVSCSDEDKTLRIWQCYEPGDEVGIYLTLIQDVVALSA